jgi:DNA replication protein DnaC
MSGRVAIAKELIMGQARDLKMPGLARAYEQLGRQAREEHWTHEDYLHEVLAAEQLSRLESAVRHRIHDARFPQLKTLDAFDFAATDGAVSPALISELARSEWISRAENLIFAGPIGTGKTHLAIALGVEAAHRRRRVLFARAADLVRLLIEARDHRELTRLHRRLYSVELLIIDELGFVPFDRTGGELLFNVVTERYERRSIVITTNLPFAEWVTIFAGDEKLTTALLDRLAHHATVITTKGKSYRMRQRQRSTTSQPHRTVELDSSPSRAEGDTPSGTPEKLKTSKR